MLIWAWTIFGPLVAGCVLTSGSYRILTWALLTCNKSIDGAIAEQNAHFELENDSYRLMLVVTL